MYQKYLLSKSSRPRKQKWRGINKIPMKIKLRDKKNDFEIGGSKN